VSETLTIWRAELEQELQDAHEQLRAARREFADAAEAARDERRALSDLMLVMGRHDPRVPLAASVQRRVTDRQDSVRRLLGAATRCEAAVTSMVGRINDLETALRQLDALQPQSAEEVA
jgi:hypothetical protein